MPLTQKLPEPPRTPTKPTGNGGAGQDDTDADEEIEETSKEKRKWNGKADYALELVKRWVTGEEAEMMQENIDRELFELSRDFMQQSKLKKCPGHIGKPTDVALWKQFQDYTIKKQTIRMRLFLCPIRHRTGCEAGIRIISGREKELKHFKLSFILFSQFYCAFFCVL
jgi:hypothetical protein